MNRSSRGVKLFFMAFVALLSWSTAQAAPVVLFDQAHGQQFLVEKSRPLDLSGLADIFSEQGATLRTNSAPITDSLLSDVDILIISGPFAPINQQEVISIMKFVYRGGKLAVMMHIPHPFNNLLPSLGIAVSSGSVAEQENFTGTSPRDFMLKDLTPHPLTQNLDSINIYGGWALLNTKKGVQIIAQTSHKAWVDLNSNGQLNDRDAMQAFPMILAGEAGKGSFVVFGDDAIFQNQFLKDNNLTLARNLAAWFCGKRQSI